MREEPPPILHHIQSEGLIHLKLYSSFPPWVRPVPSLLFFLTVNEMSARAGGSLNLDKNFENHILRNLLEEEEFIPLKKSPLYVETLKQFDQEIKPVFTTSNTRQFNVQLKGTKLTDYPDGKLRNNTMIFDKYDSRLVALVLPLKRLWLRYTRKALEVIFMPVANTVATCITEQINAVRVKKVGINSHDRTSVDVSLYMCSLNRRADGQLLRLGCNLGWWIWGQQISSRISGNKISHHEVHPTNKWVRNWLFTYLPFCLFAKEYWMLI